MELSEEEKEAIEYLKENSLVRIENEKIVAYGNSYKLIVLNLIEKQQKEIEEKTTIIMAGAEKVKQLEKEIEELKKDKKDNIQVVYGGRRYGTEVMAVKDYISKDKIREIIKELEKFDDGYNEDGEPELNWVVIEKINLLQELLEDN